MTAQTPGQAAYEDWQDAMVHGAPQVVEIPWAFLAPDAQAWWERQAAQEPQAAPGRFAAEVRRGPCGVAGHDGEHFQWRAGDWVCGRVLAASLALGGVIPVPPALNAAKPAPELAAATLLARVRAIVFRSDTQQARIRDLAELLDDAKPEPGGTAPGLAAGNPGFTGVTLNGEPLPATSASAAAVAPELAAAMAVTRRVLGWFTVNGTHVTAEVTRAQYAAAYQDGGLPVPGELRRFLGKPKGK